MSQAKQPLGFQAALIATSIFLPAAATVFTLIFVLLNWNIPSSIPVSVESKVVFNFFSLSFTLPGIQYSPIMGIIAALVAWLPASWLCRGIADPEHAIPSSYCELQPRLNELKVELGNLHDEVQKKSTACKEVKKELDEIDRELLTRGFGWVLATGYTNVWNRLYRSEEAIIEVAPRVKVLGGAYYDEARLDGSDIKNRDDLLAKLRKAVITIDPSAHKYLISTNLLTSPPTLEIGTTALPEGTVAANYSVPFLAIGGVPPYTWSVIGGTIPEGLQLSPLGVLRGTPEKDGNGNCTVRVTDNAGAMAERYFDVIVKVSAGNPPPLAVTTFALPSGTEGVQYEVKLFASGGTPPYKWSYSQKPLVGIDLNKEGLLSWKEPEPGGQYAFEVQVDDSATPAKTERRPFTLEIKPKQSILQAPAGGPGPEQLARGVLRHVRESLNLYRQSRWDGLIIARNRLLATFMLTSMIVFALLAIALMFGDEKSSVIAALVFFLVGATIGLANRLRNEAQAESAIHDYGLSAARLITVPLFSGLAAIGGILFVAYLPMAGPIFEPLAQPPSPGATTPQQQPQPAAPKQTAPQQSQSQPVSAAPEQQTQPASPTQTAPQSQTQPGAESIDSNKHEETNNPPESNGNRKVPTAPKLKDIFNLDTNLIGIFVAAVFGIAPGLLFEKLQSQADRFKTELKNSQSTGGSKNS